MYYVAMKYIFLAIFVLLAAQPMPVSSCDMHDSQQASHSGSSDMNHDMDQDMDQNMDCCDHEPSTPVDPCGSMSHCAACPSGVMAISSILVSEVFKTHARVYQPDTGELLSITNPPLFKPPIV